MIIVTDQVMGFRTRIELADRECAIVALSKEFFEQCGIASRVGVCSQSASRIHKKEENH